MIIIEEIPNFPHVNFGVELPDILAQAIVSSNFSLHDNDVLCVASKIVSTAENRIVALNDVHAGELARSIHEKVHRKDPRVIQLIIDATGDSSGNRIDVANNYIGGWLPNGLKLTSSGIDKVDDGHVILLPLNADDSARKIGEKILDRFGVHVGVVITDSDGRVDKKGATQIAIGVYGIAPLRKSYSSPKNNSLKSTSTKESVETLCDFLAAAAGIVMGQRGTNKPVVVIRGIDFEFDSNATIVQALNPPPNF